MPACLPKALLAPDVALISVLCAFAVLVTAFAALDSAAVLFAVAVASLSAAARPFFLAVLRRSCAAAVCAYAAASLCSSMASFVVLRPPPDL